MANGNVTLGYLRMQAKQRADLENNPAVSDAEWNGYLSLSYKSLYDLLVGAYGNDYYMALPYVFNLSGSQFYPLPDGSASFMSQTNAILPAFYKLAGVDLQYSGAPNGWITLRNFEFISRNKNSWPNQTSNINGYTNLKYKLLGVSQIEFIPVPAAGQAVQIWYVPEPSSLQFAPSCTLNSSTSVTVSDSTMLTVGMSVYALSGIPSGTTISAINTSTNVVTLSAAATITANYQTLNFWRDDTLIDGIAGWEEYVIVDAAIKANIKVENAIDGLIAQRDEMKRRIEAMAEGRDQGQASHVSDALSLNGYGGCDDDSWGSSGGMGGGGYF